MLLTCSDNANNASTRGRPIKHCAVLADKQEFDAPGFVSDLEYFELPLARPGPASMLGPVLLLGHKLTVGSA